MAVRSVIAEIIAFSLSLLLALSITSNFPQNFTRESNIHGKVKVDKLAHLVTK